jgi:hypothetical protein
MCIKEVVMFKIAVCTILLLTITFAAEVVTFDNNWGTHPLFNVISESPHSVEIVFSMHKMVIEDRIIDGTMMHAFGVPGIFLPNEEGAPNLFGTQRYIALPQGARAEITIVNSRTEIYRNVEVEPAPNVPLESDDSPIRYEKNMEIYSRNALYPESPVRLSEPTQIRGVDVVLVGVMPFQYNPVTKELIIYKDIRVQITFVGSNGHFGDDRLRSRFWEPILQGQLLNYNSLPKINFYTPERIMGRNGVEYIIIVPNDPVFEAWADTIKTWRQLQGISCDVYTLSQTGPDSASIKNFLQNAYDTWDPAPVAFLLLSDYPSSGRTYGITSPRVQRYGGSGSFVADNWYADFNGDHLPELHYTRICARNGDDLSTMINKFISHESNPPTAPNFYNEPLVAVAWQTGSSPRWFQLCGEVIRGFFINELLKNPAREYAVYEGTPTPGCPWSTASGTQTVVNYWNSVGYIPLTNPYDASWWNNGSPAGIAAAINSGAFLVQHRDHGYSDGSGWAKPQFVLSHIDLLNNTMFTQVYSSNCCTGMFDVPALVFAEKFHRTDYGALGINAASEASYSFYNDTYVWGIYDGLWPQFDPGYPTFDIVGTSIMHPCLAMTYGKYYLNASSWVSSGDGKWDTYNLFHEFGDCFFLLYSEVPQLLSVSHAPQLIAGVTVFQVTADDGSIIALNVNGEIIGVAEGTGSPVNITIPVQTPGNIMKVTVTKPYYFRYEADVQIVSSTYAYIIMGTTIINESGGDGQLNPGETVEYGVWVRNVGLIGAQSLYGLLDESDSYITLTVDSTWYGNIAPNDSVLSNPYYSFTIANNCPNGHEIQFNHEFHDINDSTWTASQEFTVYAPLLTYQNDSVLGGKWNNGILDPGETADLVITITNEGGAAAQNVNTTLMCSEPDITIEKASSNFGSIDTGAAVDNLSDPYTVTTSNAMDFEVPVDFSIIVESGTYSDTIDFTLVVGQLPPTDTGYYYAYYSHGPYLQVPNFSWVAIDTTQSTYPGISLDLDRNETVVVDLPFTFRYYGVDYSRISICANGWIAMDSTGSIDFSNTGIPNGDGPPAMIAGIWDYLHPGVTDAPGDIYYYYDSENHRFIVEFFKVDHYPSGNSETFEIILNDPVYYATPTGDGEIIVQYPTGIQNPSSVTVGIENAAQTIGIQYFYNGSYDAHAAPITSSFAIKYATYEPLPGVEEAEEFYTAPTTTLLGSAYPNPFSRSIMIHYQLAQNDRVNLRVYDVGGRLVRTLKDEYATPGYYSVMWHGSDDVGRKVPAGIYFVRFTTTEYGRIEKMILVK